MPLIGRSNLDKAINKLVSDKKVRLRSIFLQGLQNIQFGTPVDEGVTRNNWFYSEGVPSSKETEASSGNDFKESWMPMDVTEQTLYYTNNKASASALEYGLYPNPVKKGSWNKSKGAYEILSSGGFSKQAQGGWVRTEIDVMRKAIRNIK